MKFAENWAFFQLLLSCTKLAFCHRKEFEIVNIQTNSLLTGKFYSWPRGVTPEISLLNRNLAPPDRGCHLTEILNKKPWFERGLNWDLLGEV